MTMIGVLLLVLEMLRDQIGATLPDTGTDDTLTILLNVLGVLMAAYGRWRKGDLTLGVPVWLLAAILLAAILLAGCATAPATVTQPQEVTQPQTADQGAGQGVSTASAAAGNAQSGIGDSPNRQGVQPSRDDGVEVQTPALDAEGRVIVDADGKPLMTTIKGRGLRDLYIASKIENSADATVSGNAEGVTQGQTGTPTATQAPTTTQTPTATNQPSVPVDINVTPGSGGP